MADGGIPGPQRLSDSGSPSGLLGVGLIVLRALSIFFGGTVVAHWLATNTGADNSAVAGAIPSYWSWLAQAVSLESTAAQALGNTLLLTAAGALFGMVIAFAISNLLRIDKIGSLLGFLSAPIMALAVPGIALYPLFRVATDQGWAPLGPMSFDEAVGETLRFLTLWGVGIGLAVAPGLTVLFSGPQGRSGFGLNIAGGWLSSRSEPATAWRVGIPSTALVLAVTSAELVSGQPGLFHEFGVAVRTGQLVEALDLALIVVAAGAAIAVAIDVAAMTMPSDGVPEQVAVKVSASAWKPVLALTALAAIGAVGYAGYVDGDSAGDAAVFAGPRFGGPWLGTDGAGRSVAGQVIEALGPTLLAGLLPAVFALFFGGLLALLRRLVPLGIDRTIGALTDLLWWPTPLVLPLAYLHYGIPERSEFHPGIIVFTGLAITPMTTRLLGPLFHRTTTRTTGFLAAAVFITAVGAAIRVLVGFMGVTGAGDTNTADLGAMLGAGIADYSNSVWPTIAPLAMSVLALSLLYWTAAALVVPAPVPELIPLPVVPEPTQPITQPITRPMGILGGSEGPSTPQDLRTITRATDTIVLQGVSGQPLFHLEHDQPATEAAEVNTAEVQTGEPASADSVGSENTRSSDPRSAVKLTSNATVAEVQQSVVDASRTIELRPSTLRRAGIRAHEQQAPPMVLSERPAPPAHQPDDDPLSAESEDRSD